MTVVHMSEKGQVVVPKAIRDKRGYTNGSAFLVSETQSGQLLLRPVKAKPKMSLADRLRKFRGLEVPEIKARFRPRL